MQSFNQKTNNRIGCHPVEAINHVKYRIILFDVTVMSTRFVIYDRDEFIIGICISYNSHNYS